MKKLALLSLGLILAFPAIGHCQAAAPADAGKGAPPQAAAPSPAEDLAQFPARKAEIIKGMEDRIAMLEKAKSCVEAAKDHETLKECIPHRTGGPGMMGGPGGPGGMGPGGMHGHGPHSPGGPAAQQPGGEAPAKTE